MSKGAIPALPEGYADWLAQLKGCITQAQHRAARAVNAELMQLYHRLGVAKYQLLRELPDTSGRDLPSIAKIEAELAVELDTGSDVE